MIGNHSMQEEFAEALFGESPELSGL